MAASFFWHDYETSGTNPVADRPMQFAGVRTDEELNIIGQPLTMYCKLAPDTLPHPMACAVTGISPQHANREGMHEHEFIGQIHAQMMQPNTCSVGYNSIRFDDEFTRNILYRNFHDAYEREYKNGNSRWDLIDVVRLCCALRPDGIEWPTGDDGKPSFRLEKLTAANGIEHSGAHDAMADVYATIELARILKNTKPRLFDYTLKLRNKRYVAGLLQTRGAEPLLHVSSKLPSETYCSTLVLPVAVHPNNPNGVICVDLRQAPSALFDLDASQITRYMYMPRNERDAATPNIPLKTIHLNRSPIIATARLLDDAASQRINIDRDACERHAELLRKNTAWLDKLQDIFALPELAANSDVDEQLYSGGFFSNQDKQQMAKVRAASANELAASSYSFDDGRLAEMLLRYRARNFPQSLNSAEDAQWREYCARRLGGSAGFSWPQFSAELELLAAESTNTGLVEDLARYQAELAANVAE